MSFTIRPYEPGDRQGCLDAFISNIPDSFTPTEIADFENWLNELDSPRAGNEKAVITKYYVAQRADIIAGCGGLYIDLEKNTATLAWGLAHKNHQGVGIGKALLEFRLSVMENQYPHFPIHLDTTQHVYPFFLKKGFVIKKITKDFYTKGLDRYDMTLDK